MDPSGNHDNSDFTKTVILPIPIIATQYDTIKYLNGFKPGFGAMFDGQTRLCKTKWYQDWICVSVKCGTSFECSQLLQWTIDNLFFDKYQITSVRITSKEFVDYNIIPCEKLETFSSNPLIQYIKSSISHQHRYEDVLAYSLLSVFGPFLEENGQSYVLRNVDKVNELLRHIDRRYITNIQKQAIVPALCAGGWNVHESLFESGKAEIIFGLWWDDALAHPQADYMNMSVTKFLISLLDFTMELSGYLEDYSELEWAKDEKNVDLVRQVEATKANVMFCDGLAEIKAKVNQVYAHFRSFYGINIREPLFHQDDGSLRGWGRRDGVDGNNISGDIDSGDNGEDEDNRPDCKYGKRAEGWKECEEPCCSVKNYFCDNDDCQCWDTREVHYSKSRRMNLSEMHHPDYWGSDWDSDMAEEEEEEEEY